MIPSFWRTLSRKIAGKMSFGNIRNLHWRELYLSLESNSQNLCSQDGFQVFFFVCFCNLIFAVWAAFRSRRANANFQQQHLWDWRSPKVEVSLSYAETLFLYPQFIHSFHLWDRVLHLKMPKWVTNHIATDDRSYSSCPLCSVVYPHVLLSARGHSDQRNQILPCSWTYRQSRGT